MFLAAMTSLTAALVSMPALAAGAAVGPEGGLTSLTSGEAIIALITLASLEIVLGIDNVVFISILVGKLPPEKQPKARRLGLGLAMGMRILLLLAIGWIMQLTTNLFYLPKFWAAAETYWHGISGRDLILIIGGLFLVGKATHEIHGKLEGPDAHGKDGPAKATASFGAVLLQIILLDIVFSLDSVITAVGMVKTAPGKEWIGLSVMITAVVISVGVMLFAAGPIARFVEKHPTMKMLALSFLILIGVVLLIEGFEGHVNKAYIYFAMAFSLAVEVLNMRMRKAKEGPVKLHNRFGGTPGTDAVAAATSAPGSV